MRYFDYGEDPEFDIEEFLEGSQQREKERLEEELEQIEHQLEERDRIFEENREELESKLDWYINRLRDEYKSWGRDSVDELKQKIDQLYRWIREEKVQKWRDQQELEKERRQLISELEELDSEPGLEELL